MTDAIELDILAVCSRLDSGQLTLPVALAEGVELDVADGRQIAAIRPPLRLLEARLSKEAVPKHKRATVLDRRFQVLDWSPGKERSTDPALARELVFGEGGWIEPVKGYGDLSRDELLVVAVTHDLATEDSYHILRLAGGWERVGPIWTALQLLEQPVHAPFGFTWMQGGPPEQNCGVDASGWIICWLDESVEELREAWSTEQLSQPVRIDSRWCEDARVLLDAVEKLRQDPFPNIVSALQRRAELRSVPAGSPLRHLGYFIVIESLLTHSPAPTDPADSIGRQLQTKIPLLSHRMDRPIPFDALDKNADPLTLLKALYEYRSSIAHGSQPHFSGKQAVLGSSERVGRFLEIATRRLLRQAVLEPRLVTDLKGPMRNSP